MASSSQGSSRDERTNQLLRDLLITQLSVVGVGQLQIRAIVGCDIHDVNRIAKVVAKALKSKQSNR
jgi:hypothetical protein